MSKITTKISVDSDIEPKAQALFAELGLDLSSAVNIFLRQAVSENGFPFSIGRRLPNADTRAAMAEFDELSAHPENFKKYSSFSELLREVEADA